MEALVIGLIRVAGSLPVLRWAFVGALIAVFIDLSDLFWRQLIDLGGIPEIPIDEEALVVHRSPRKGRG